MWKFVQPIWLIACQCEGNPRTSSGCTYLVNKSHLRIKSWVDRIHREYLTLDGIGVTAMEDIRNAAFSSSIVLLVAMSLDVVVLREDNLFSIP